MKNLVWKGIGASKKQRENALGQIGPLEMQNLLNAYAAMGATHIEVIHWSKDTTWLNANGFNLTGPYQTTIEAVTQMWYTMVHNTPNIYGPNVYGGYLKVLDRCVFPTTEGDVGGVTEQKASGTSTSASTDGQTTWCGEYYNYLYNHVKTTNLQTGDIMEPFAEYTGSVFSHNWLTGGNYHAMFQQMQTIANIAAGANNASITFMINPNWTEENSGYSSDYLTTGINCFDYYGQGPDGLAPVTGADYVKQLKANFNGQNFGNNNNNPPGYGLGTAGYPMSWNEWGDLSGSVYKNQSGMQGVPVRTGDNFVSGTTQVEQFVQYWFTFFKQLRDNLVNVTPQILKGFFYWGGWEGQNTSLLWKTGSGETSKYYPNWRGQMLANFYINDGMRRMPIIRAGNFNDGIGGRNQYF